MSTASESSSSLPPCVYAARAQLVRGRSIGGLRLKPNRRMYSYIVSLPSRSPTCAQTVLTEFVSAVVSVTGPKSSLPKLESGTPPIVFGELPLSTESGVKRPLSSAAVAVTTLNVEPGG